MSALMLASPALGQSPAPTLIASPVQGGFALPPVSSCDAIAWPATLVTCVEADMSASLGMAIVASHIWLTTIGAVDAAWSPTRQVADHPAAADTPVWVFVHDGFRPPIRYANEDGQEVESPPETRVLHVVAANDPSALEGAFVYIYGWSELGDPDLPAQMPTIEPTPAGH